MGCLSHLNGQLFRTCRHGRLHLVVLCHTRHRVNLYANANGHRSRSLCAAPTLIGDLPLLSRLIYDSPLRYGYAECTAQCRVVHHALYVERSLLYAYVGTVKHNSLHFAQNAWNGHRQRLSPIRVFGTVGFIATMWFVNCATTTSGFGLTLLDDAQKFQYTHMQFLVSGVLGILLFIYCFTLPQCKLESGKSQSLYEAFGLDAFKLFKTKRMALFFIFSCLLGMSLQVTNGYATPFITSFKANMPDSFAANNATLLVSISQVAEAICILFIPFFLRRYGIKVVMIIAMLAWVLRFGFFGLGNPAMPGVMLFILSCIVYGVAFDFFNVSGGLFVDQECDPKVKASAQGLFMLMTNGLGATIGTLLAGEVINHYCQWTAEGYLVGDWQTCWFIFAGYALVVLLLFAFVFSESKEHRVQYRK